MNVLTTQEPLLFTVHVVMAMKGGGGARSLPETSSQKQPCSSIPFLPTKALQLSLVQVQLLQKLQVDEGYIIVTAPSLWALRADFLYELFCGADLLARAILKQLNTKIRLFIYLFIYELPTLPFKASIRGTYTLRIWIWYHNKSVSQRNKNETKWNEHYTVTSRYRCSALVN